MEIKCPSCHKLNKDVTDSNDTKSCKRCGSDLSKLYAIIQTARRKAGIAKSNLLRKRAEAALSYAEESWRLKHSVKAARLAFLACVAQKKYKLALCWNLRASQYDNFKT